MPLDANFSGGPHYAGTPNYAVPGRYLVDIEIGTARYEFGFIEAPNVDGVADKYYGFRGQKIMLKVCYVGDFADLISLMTQDSHDLAGPIDLNLNGTVFKACFIESFKPASKLQSTETGVAYKYIDVTVDSKRLDD